MARSGDSLAEREIWCTWSDLLLACAVNRHGTRSWDEVAMEIRSRIAYAHILTPHSCKERYRDLKRRFAAGGEEIEGGDSVDGDGDGQSAAKIPWLEELKNLRMAELRRDVERYDASIGSLQLKVKRLKEERERSVPEEEEAGDGGSGSDLRKKIKDEERKDQSDSPRSTPENAAGDQASGGDSGRSCKESNSTDPKEEEGKAGDEIREEPEAAPRSGSGSDPVAGGETSYNGSSDTIARGAAAPPAPAAEANPVGESGESVAESKGGEAEGTKESSDVQSSASLSRRRRRGRRRKVAALSVSSSGGGGDEPEADAVSPVRKAVDAESQPLMAFLEIIWSSEYGSVFERRLESQECGRYRSLIRRHVDLEMVRNKIGRSGYTRAEFFRDLLLLCNNALVFYPKNSPESTAAVHLRTLINKEVSTASTRKPPLPSPPAAVPPKESSPPPPPVVPKPKSDPDRVSSALDKPPALAPLVACKKRSSISAKPPAAAAAAKKVEKDEKPVVEEKEQVLDKKSTKQRTVVSRGLRSNKTRASNGNKGGVVKSSNTKPNNPPVVTAEAEEKPEKKSGGGATTAVSAAKKRSAANFLNRMKRSSPPSSNGTLLESMKSSTAGKGGDQKKGTRGDARKEKEKEKEGGQAKRSVGRPPKRAASTSGAKRMREEKTPPPPPPRKRGRR